MNFAGRHDGVKVFRKPRPTSCCCACCRCIAGFQRPEGAANVVKNVHGAHPITDNCLRVTIGTPAENDAFLNVLSELL